MRTIYIDPAYSAYYQDRLFDEANPVLNRDDTLAPNVRMRAALEQTGATVHTADFLLAQTDDELDGDYYSFGVMHNYRVLAAQPKIRMRASIKRQVTYM